MKDIFVGEIHEREKVGKYIGKYVNFLELFYINLVYSFSC